ncbi:MAG: IS110 family transposase [Acidobacteria bacterium]|nr:IS110 family transposase [Acidobacteriota bacterium]
MGKRMIAVTVMTGPAQEEPVIDTREYRAINACLLQLWQWLREQGCTAVAMESTGSYW